MHIRHKVKTIKLLAPGTPVLDSTEVVTQVQVTAGLDAGEHSFLGSHFFHGIRLYFK